MSDSKFNFNLDDDNDQQDASNQEPKIEAAQQSSSPPFQGSGGDGNDDDYGSEEAFETDKERLMDFYKFPRDKRQLTEFLEETYKTYEQENVERVVQRAIHEHKSEVKGSTPFYKPGHIGPLMYEFLNMIGVEAAFVSGLQHTKSSITKSVQQRADEINSVMRGVGGFNRQLKASFSRSAVSYLEQEDPENSHREKIAFSVNVADYELRYPLDEEAENQTVEDGRTLRRMVWDEAVNTLAEIVSNTGLKPKFVQNNKNECSLMMRQELLIPGEYTPDEFFDFDFRYITQPQIQERAAQYQADLEKYEKQIARMTQKMNSIWTSKSKQVALDEELRALKKKRDFFIGTTWDPKEIDPGLIFSISVNSLKDHAVTKDRMQVIMTKFILALSSIAVDKSSDQQVSTVYQQGQKDPVNFQTMGAKVKSVKGVKKRPA